MKIDIAYVSFRAENKWENLLSSSNNMETQTKKANEEKRQLHLNILSRVYVFVIYIMNMYAN